MVQVERVGGVVGGADDADLHQFEDAAGREVAVLQLAVGFVPDLLGRGAFEDVLDAEVAA